MASFIYLYSKFTEELLLLSAAGIFTLLSVYCYTWVVKKRRLGAARDQVPAGLVRVYLGQLINEAQFVRTQLFGLTGGAVPSADSFAAHFQNHSGAHAGDNAQATSPTASATTGEIPADLLERLKALENQLSDKESMVVNINVEKTKLLEEVEHLKQNAKATGAAAAGATGNNDELLQKMKALEERLEEYALFEDDLANLKRLQQENAQLKKQIDQGANKAAAAPAPTPAAPEPAEPIVAATASKEPFLDQSAIDALLNGVSAIPPTPVSEPVPEAAPTTPQADPTPITSISAKPATAAPEAAPKPTGDDFENLVDSIENSLSAKAPEAVAAVAVTAPTPAAVPAPEMAAPVQASAVSSSAEKTDEELLKEFENLLNS